MNNEKSISQMINDIFAPFTLSLWVVTLCVLILLSFLFILQEIPWSKFKKAPVATAGLAAYNALLGLFAQGSVNDDPMTWGGRFTLLAIAVQILLVGASYTANLTNFLVRGGLQISVESVEDAIGQRLRVCVLRNKIAILDNTYGKDIIRYAIDPVDGLPGFPDRAALFPAMDDGICSCAVAGLEEMAVFHGAGLHCEKNTVGKPVIELSWGIPVSNKYAAPFNTAITRLIQNGEWRHLSDVHKPESMCLEMVVDSSITSLNPAHLSGAYVLSGILAMIGIIVSLVTLAMKRRRNRYGNRNPNRNCYGSHENHKIIISRSQSQPDQDQDRTSITSMTTTTAARAMLAIGQQQQQDGESSEFCIENNENENNNSNKRLSSSSPPSDQDHENGNGNGNNGDNGRPIISNDYVFDNDYFRSAMASLTEEIASLKEAVIVVANKQQ